MSSDTLTNTFPNLACTDFDITSPCTTFYNCIAWAAGDNTRWWWPDIMGTSFWPPTVPRAENIQAFQKVFEQLGYITCDNGDLEKGCIKICIFTDDNFTPTHAARQLENGFWTSKCGNLEDISHELEGLTGNKYGKVTLFMKRNL